MIVTGIIVEYNPFHNGHSYHIQQARALTKCDLLIAIMSPTFMQRGEPALLNKFIRTEVALNNGVDMVIELPSYYAIQSANYFAQGALKLLNELKINYLVFGMESDNLAELKKAAQISLIPSYQEDVALLIKKGLRYANACNEAFKQYGITNIEYANDILALAYLQEIYQNNYQIEAVSLKRTNNYLSKDLSSDIVSATAIRAALIKNIDISKYTKMNEEIKTYDNELVFFNDFFNILKYKIISMSISDLQSIHGMVEGIEYKIKNSILKVNNINELILTLSSKRYPQTRIQRLLVYIICHITKQEIASIDIDYLRILGMNIKGQAYLKVIKNQTNYKMVTTYSNHKNNGLDLELRISQIYSLASLHTNYLAFKEYQQAVIIKK
ncbi:MAG: nucleotidyltransferase [Bacilli bacterium]|jgi:predicted nucleotidyltransferase|nr:nucleotidyltransferase [Bacilli bacterium]